MKSNSIKSSRRESSKKTNTIDNFIILALSVLIVAAPLFSGLFFQKEILISHVVSFGVFTLYLANKVRNKEEVLFLNSPYDFIGLSFILVYFLPIITNQWVNLRDSIGILIRYGNYFCIYLMVKDMSGQGNYKRVIEKALLFGSVIVALIGILGAIGLVNLDDVVLSSRIASTFQYPNTLAALMMSMLFLVMGNTNSQKKTWGKLLYGAIGYIMLFAFIYTYSRAAWILLPLFILIYLIALPSKERVSSLLYFISIAVSNILIIQPFSNYSSINSSIKVKALITFIVGIALFLIFYSCIIYAQSRLQRNQFKYINSIIYISIAVCSLFSYIALTTFEPLVFNNMDIAENRINQVQRTITGVNEEAAYTLSIKHQAQSKDVNHWPWYISIYSVDKEKKQEQLTEKIGAAAESGVIEVPFTTMKSTEKLSIYITNMYPETKVIFEEIVLKDEEGHEINRVKLKYKYIPETLISRVNSISLAETNASTRITYYKDSVSIFKKHPVFGAGGGAWKALYPKFQSQDYTSTEAHNFFMQTLVETGTLGIIVLVLLILVLLLNLFKMYKNKDVMKISILIAVLSLLAHSGLDFNFSFHSIPIFLWVLIAMLDFEIIAEGESLFDKVLPTRNKRISLIISMGFTILLLFSSISLLVSYQLVDTASKSYNKAPLSESINKIEKAILLDSFNSKTRADLAKLLSLHGERAGEYRQIQQAEKHYQKAYKYNPYDTDIIQEIAHYYLVTGNFDEAYKYIDKNIEVAPLRQSSYDFKSQVYNDVGNFYLSQNKIQEALGIYSKMLLIANEVNAANQRAEKPVQLSNNTFKRIFYAKYYLENYNNQKALSEFNDSVYFTYLGLEGATGFQQPWKKWNSENSKIEYKIDESGLAVYNKGENFGIVYSPFFYLEAEKSYEVRVILSEKSTLHEINTWIISETGHQIQASHKFSVSEELGYNQVFSFTTTRDIEPGKQYIRFDHPGNNDKQFTVTQINIRKID